MINGLINLFILMAVTFLLSACNFFASVEDLKSVESSEVLPRAEVQTVPTGITLTSSYVFPVTGVAKAGRTVTGYKYKIEPLATANCNDSGGYSAEVPIATAINLNLPNSGTFVLCSLAIDSQGDEQPLANATMDYIRYDAISKLSFGPDTVRMKSTDSFISVKAVLDYPKPYDLVLKFNNYSSGSLINNFIAPTTLELTVPEGEMEAELLIYTLNFSAAANSDINYLVNLEEHNSDLLQISSNSNLRYILGDYLDEDEIKFSTISGSEDHDCAINFNQKIYCWGTNSYGQLGLGDIVNRRHPTLVPGATLYKSVHAGWWSTCAIDSTDHLWCWGRNNYGQLGNGNTGTDQLSPVAIDAANTYKMIAHVGAHVCGLRSDDKLYCWGRNNYGQLGNGNTGTDQNTPQPITPAVTYKFIGAGDSNSFAIDSNDDLWAWGYNSNDGLLGNGLTAHSNVPVQSDVGSKYKYVNGGEYQTCGITLANQLRCWGDNWAGSLGDGTTTGSLVPVTVLDTDTYAKVKVGYEFVCGITTAGFMKCWGNSGYGRTGTGFWEYDHPGQHVPNLIGHGEKYLDIASGYWHSCAIDESNYLKCTGSNYNFINMSGYILQSTNFVEIKNSKKLIFQASGEEHSCRIYEDNKLYCSGVNDFGQLGDGSTSSKSYPAKVIGSDNWLSVGVGYQASCGLNSANKIKCWGRGEYDAVGRVYTTPLLTPTEIDSTESFKAMAYNGVGCAISMDDELYCWTGTVPTPAHLDAGVKYKAVGDGLCAVRTTDGQLRCWNDALTVVTDLLVGTPVKKISQSGVARHRCVITDTDALYCWGTNWSGQVGTGSTSAPIAAPTLIDAGTGYKEIVGGSDSSCGLTTLNKVKCWGQNDYSQLGIGTLVDNLAPIQITLPGDFKGIYTGYRAACALDTTDKLYCWGANFYGQYANGYSIDHTFSHVLFNPPN